MTSMHRLFVPGSLRSGNTLLLDAERSHYVSRVLRLSPGSELILFDGSGGEYPATIAAVSRKSLTVRVGEHRQRNVESPLAIRLIQGISRGERMDIVVQKATELGVRRILPVTTEFSVVRLDAGKAEKRLQHWRRIAASACEQSGRDRVPEIDRPQTLSELFRGTGTAASTRVMLHPGANGSIASLENPGESLDLLIGPEGGLSNTEAEQAVAAGFAPRSLGPRILRTETAAIAALTVVQAAWGDLA